jgi:adenylate cyclase
MLDKYIGDAMMVIFNAPLDVDNHAERACLSALEMISKQQKISEDLKLEDFPEVNIGIGINTGLAIVGNMGSTVRFGYTAIGDSVNLAARLEGLNKGYGTEIIISEFTKSRLPENTKIKTRMLDKIRVKGKVEPVTIYEIFDEKDIKNKFVIKFESALNKYFVSDFDVAIKEFSEIANEYQDKASENFIQRCEHYLENPPANDWGGIHDMKTK